MNVKEMSEEAIVITKQEIAKFLKSELERKPTEEEINGFMGFLKIDIYEWLRDNFKAWIQE